MAIRGLRVNRCTGNRLYCPNRDVVRKPSMLSVLRLSNELLILSVLRRVVFELVDVVFELFGTWCFIRISCFVSVLLVPSGTSHEDMLILFARYWWE